MSQAIDRAREFLSNQKAFRLGELLTESSHPKTRNLSETINAEITSGIRMMQSVDRDIPPVAKQVLDSKVFAELVESFLEVLASDNQIYFTGCGATGRLSILLEAAWKEFWQQLQKDHPETAAKLPPLEDRCTSVMAGGDFALIKSVEGFEDFPEFGKCQLSQAGIRKGDLVVAITEGGETPFVIGTAWQGMQAGAKVFFVYNNPTQMLAQHVQRSREIIEEPQIKKLDLATGPMTITGSTRMQATTIELLIVGAALETAISKLLQEHLTSAELKKLKISVNPPQHYSILFEQLLSQLECDDCTKAMAELTAFEENIYRKQGLITYIADSLMLDVLTDTTERSPTFMVPPFRKQGDTISPVSWAFVKNPYLSSEQAWQQMLRRRPRGIEWDVTTYQKLNAPPALQASPPLLDNKEIFKFRIGNEPDASRTDAPVSALVFIAPSDEISALALTTLKRIHRGYQKAAAITLGRRLDIRIDRHFHFSVDLPHSPLKLWHHLAIKLILNTISTGTMVRLGRVRGNAMIWLSPSNKKLIDRGSRLISQVTQCSYEKACEMLHIAIEQVSDSIRKGEQAPSPVALAIDMITAGSNQSQ